MSLGPGAALKKACELTRCQASGERCLEDGQYYCCFPLPSGSSAEFWSKRSSPCAPVLQLGLEGHTCSVRAVCILGEHWKDSPTLLQENTLRRKRLYFTDKPFIIGNQKGEHPNRL